MVLQAQDRPDSGVPGQGGERRRGKLVALAVWLRDYGEGIEADLAFRGIDLLDFYRGRMCARRLWVLVHNLPPDSLTANIASGQVRRPEDPQGNVTYLEDIPKVGLREAQQFVNAKPEEFFSKVGAS